MSGNVSVPFANYDKVLKISKTSVYIAKSITTYDSGNVTESIRRIFAPIGAKKYLKFKGSLFFGKKI